MTEGARFVSLLSMGKHALRFAVSIGLLACGDSGSDAGDKDDEQGSLPSCAESCPPVLAAKCSHGPVDQADCESGCETIRASTCVPLYEAMIACAGAKPRYTCDDLGQVTPSDCEDEIAALYSCLAKR
jgi:hypothetical protein